jgi:hypothetical protein
VKKQIEKRFKGPDDPMRLVIVRDMCLTDLDAPCVHTMYVDKPMKGHNLMQAITRVNRVFCEKQGGLVVLYLSYLDFAFRHLGEICQDAPVICTVTPASAANLPVRQTTVRRRCQCFFSGRAVRHVGTCTARRSFFVP